MEGNFFRVVVTYQGRLASSYRRIYRAYSRGDITPLEIAHTLVERVVEVETSISRYLVPYMIVREMTGAVWRDGDWNVLYRRPLLITGMAVDNLGGDHAGILIRLYTNSHIRGWLKVRGTTHIGTYGGFIEESYAQRVENAFNPILWRDGDKTYFVVERRGYFAPITQVRVERNIKGYDVLR